MTYEEVCAIALELAETAEAPYYNGTSMLRGGRLMFSPQKDEETFSIKVDWDSHDRLLADHPVVLFKTPHYEGHPSFRVRLDLLEPALARELVLLSWTDAPKPGKRRPR